VAENRRCYLCENQALRKRKGAVRDNPALDILECLSCGLVFLSSFDHIDGRYYHEARMHETPLDADAWLKVTMRDDDRRFAALKRSLENKSVLDFGCGAGGFLMKARAVSSRVAGVELEERLKGHFKEVSLDVCSCLEDTASPFDVITLFHVLEHLKDPIGLLSKLKDKLADNGRLIIEVPSANDALLTLYENEAFSRFTYWSCHLFLFTDATLLAAAQKAGLKPQEVRQTQRYPLSNHLYWLAKGKPGGHDVWGHLDSEELGENYEKQLASAGMCDTITGIFSK